MNPRTRRQRRNVRNARHIVCWRTHAVVYAASSKPWRGSYEAHENRCTRAAPKALAPRGHVYEHGRCRQCNVTEPPAVGYGQPSDREGR